MVFFIFLFSLKKLRLDVLISDDNEANFRERVKRITFKFKELAQKEEYQNKTIAIVASRNFISQVFSWINNIENFLESKKYNHLFI